MFRNINDKVYQKISGSKQGYDVIEYGILYDTGSYNYWSGQIQTRGYYLTASPCSRHGVVRSYTMLGDEMGSKIKIKDVATRRSKRSDSEAIEEANKRIAEIAEAVASRCGYTLGAIEE